MAKRALRLAPVAPACRSQTRECLGRGKKVGLTALQRVPTIPLARGRSCTHRWTLPEESSVASHAWGFGLCGGIHAPLFDLAELPSAWPDEDFSWTRA